MSTLTALRSIALKEPSTLLNSVLYKDTETTLVVFDAYPKSLFHFLVLPRVHSPFTIGDLANLRSLLRKGREPAKKLVHELKAVAESLKHDIEAEMVRRYGFKWEVWMGFHGAPSMVHLHLHVLSADLCSEKMKYKKHYNSFHPKLGFFLDIEKVLSWFDATPSLCGSIIRTDPATYDQILKEPLVCFRCDRGMKNVPTLKQHLQEEWESLAKQERLKAGRKANSEHETRIGKEYDEEKDGEEAVVP